MNRSSADPILVIDGVSKRYGGLDALKDVSLEVRSGELHSVVGPNGAGKSTLFNLVCGIEKADAGQIAFRGTRIERMRAPRIARLGIARKFQAPSLFPQLTVVENLRVAASGRRGLWRVAITSGEREENLRVERLLEEFDLASLAGELGENLAHGEQQRLETAMVMATEPALVLLDEPTAGLSAEETAAIGEMLKGLSESVSVLVVEHDLAFIRQVSDWVTVLDHGKNLVDGDVDTIAAEERVRVAYLGGHEL